MGAAAVGGTDTQASVTLCYRSRIGQFNHMPNRTLWGGGSGPGHHGGAAGPSPSPAVQEQPLEKGVNIEQKRESKVKPSGPGKPSRQRSIWGTLFWDGRGLRELY